MPSYNINHSKKQHFAEKTNYQKEINNKKKTTQPTAVNSFRCRKTINKQLAFEFYALVNVY